MTSWSEIERQVQRRAAARCEYCLMHDSLQGATFHVALELNTPRRLRIREAEKMFDLFPPSPT
jgi:hypothetical protein